jgi:DNA-binding GntR family transcriptional regulator
MNKIEKQQNTPEEQVARELEEDIIFGRLQPGTRLREDALLERFGGTRHFIRQALTRLERAGIVTHERNRGAKVRSFSSAEVRQVYDVRELLQRQAALNIPLPVPPKIVSRLQEINQEYRECIAIDNRRGIHENNDIFHKVFYAACDNPYLTDLIRDYMDITLAIRAKNLADPGLLQVSIAHHDLMIKYLQGSDNWVLAELCVEHVRPSKEQYLEMLGD